MATALASPPDFIRLRGIRQNNLKGFDLDLPLGKLIVVTGPSGAGKSSLVFETLHAEGQRRYVETFSPYARQFMEMLARPDVEAIENIRPSIAIAQGNTVKTSRSTVGTMTELCDFFKVWFCHRATLFDPETGLPVESDDPASIWRKASHHLAGKEVVLTFRITKPEKLTWTEITQNLQGQGYTRALSQGRTIRLEEISPATGDALEVVQDRLKLTVANEQRFLESARTALHFGRGQLSLHGCNGQLLAAYSEGLHVPGTDRHFRAATPALFSFNSPVGACERCRGFGRVIEIDPRLVIPDQRLSLAMGAIRAFQGEVYSESQRDLLRACRKHGIPADIPYRDLTPEQQAFVWEGEPGYGEGGREWPHGWYGVRRFFAWLEQNTYKMHVRVFLSKYRAYVTCQVCHGTRLKPEASLWQWEGHTLPQLYELPVSALLALLDMRSTQLGHRQADLARESILTRLRYLQEVGLGYLSLNRASRTLSGGEVERVNLTACLGTGLVDTLFVLDEPSVGLHARDIDRLIGILRRLTDQGNTVVVVEHDEAIMRAADHLIEIGPEPGARGGELVFQGSFSQLHRAERSLTADYLLGRRTINPPSQRRAITRQTPRLHLEGITKHNLRGLDVALPLQRLVVLTGVSGSGKSTLLDNACYQSLLAARGQSVEDPAAIESLHSDLPECEVVLVDQSPVSRTPRSNPVLFVDAWEPIRQLFAATSEARAHGLGPGQFSFNSGNGRCEHCQGLGHEKVEMQFMADVYLPCPICEGQRFKPEVLAITWNGKNAAEVLALTVDEAAAFLARQPKVASRLRTLSEVGLGYLPLGQPLNTLSGGESQRLKLVKYLIRLGDDGSEALLLLDEPTTGLHRHDVQRLLGVLQQLCDRGHSVVVIEHQIDIIKSADWILELGPEAGADGGKLVFEGTPEALARAHTATSRYLAEALDGGQTRLFAAEPDAAFAIEPAHRARCLDIEGAREHNLKNLTTRLPLGKLCVITGVSGSGKSTLAFDIIFAEGQRRFMESMSAWARQYVEQLPRPEVDHIHGIPPTVAIEQRVTRGSRKSTVATITEIAQYLRLLYARIGVPHSPVTGEPLLASDPAALHQRLGEILRQEVGSGTRRLHLCAPLVRGRKGHHQPLADWARAQGFSHLRCDGVLLPLENFKKLDRYREHDVEVVTQTIDLREAANLSRDNFLAALKLGKGATFLCGERGKVVAWFSTTRTDPATGESFPELDPKHFSWNSARGWCPTCHGHGILETWMLDDESFTGLPANLKGGEPCPACGGSRLNPLARAVRLYLKNGASLSLPELLALPPSRLLETLKQLQLDKRGRAILKDVRPEIEERLRFMGEVGLDYLTLDRATSTLSGGEAQRIRLAAHLGSNLSGALFVLDEPSIGLHARDNARLLTSLERLRDKGNSLLVVEHDEETMRRADHLLDLGPAAGRHGGEILAQGKLAEVLAEPRSTTARALSEGIPHPLRGQRRKLPPAWKPRRKAPQQWLVLEKASLRNLKGFDLHLPLGRLIAVCGPSGAGKSTLIRDLLCPLASKAAREGLARLQGHDGTFRKLHGADGFRSVIEVDQSPIGKTPRSTPATYLGAFDLIRQHFGNLPEARMRGLDSGSFSFNTKGGRCETCKGAGRVKLEMGFMPDAYVPCDDCQGRRYGPELAGIEWGGKTIADILAMSFEEAAEFFDFHPRLRDMLRLMVETGLGYLTLGQTSPTLSGGEAQRLKLVSELSKGLPTYTERQRGLSARNLYLLEEPTIGLHLADVRRLLELFHRLADQGHTIVVIEHHLDVLAEADYLVEIGPGGGEHGGQRLYQGPPEGLLTVDASPTAPFLRQLLAKPLPKPKRRSA